MCSIGNSIDFCGIGNHSHVLRRAVKRNSQAVFDIVELEVTKLCGWNSVWLYHSVDYIISVVKKKTLVPPPPI